ncbi:hypothetical protein [Synechococcus sp. LA31]|uniref:hypothetical protein n=1 Tax=Synechococcus sp. LA31 TaxID=2741953 RepID=UPI001BDBB452|nr:hypothetical protein [Synechococcus sp. LA31]QVV67216.1 hypothetical protein KJJ24_12365 [Synechococcus sp. LA31]
MQASMRLLLHSAVACAGGCLLTAAVPASAQTCQFLAPVGGNGVTDIITKTISPGNPLPFSRPNWNTDFFVTQPYSSYKLFFTANSSVSATYPIQAYLKFTDGSNLQVINDSYAPQTGTGRQWNVQAVPGKTVSQVNFKIGASGDQAATGFTYRISAQGCN